MLEHRFLDNLNLHSWAMSLKITPEKVYLIPFKMKGMPGEYKRPVLS